MRILYSAEASEIAANDQVKEILASVSENFLRDVVRALAFPRHFVAEPTNNRLAAHWIAAQLQAYGYQTFYQGPSANVVALPSWERPGVGFPSQEAGLLSARLHERYPPCVPPASGGKDACLPRLRGTEGGELNRPASPEGNPRKDVILVGAHYDTVPGTPGADDNASALAALLGCAKAVAEYAKDAPVCFVAFNREEDHLTGSRDFVNTYVVEHGLPLAQAHILEMVGYCRRHPQSQRKPLGLPVNIPNQGDFLGVIGNTRSNFLIAGLLQQAQAYLPDLPVVGLQVCFGLEKFFYHLLRSDHASFWRRGLPALMWTDTANFRNPHYHRPTDTPDTLDYSFLRRVTQLLLLQILTFSRGRGNAVD